MHDRDVNAAKNILNCQETQPLFQKTKEKSLGRYKKKVPVVNGEFTPMESNALLVSPGETNNKLYEVGNNKSFLPIE
mgnify:CR=1 FL=1